MKSPYSEPSPATVWSKWPRLCLGKASRTTSPVHPFPLECTAALEREVSCWDTATSSQKKWKPKPPSSHSSAFMEHPNIAPIQTSHGLIFQKPPGSPFRFNPSGPCWGTESLEDEAKLVVMEGYRPCVQWMCQENPPRTSIAFKAQSQKKQKRKVARITEHL